MPTPSEKIFEFLSRGTTYPEVRLFLLRVLEHEKAKQNVAYQKFRSQESAVQANRDYSARRRQGVQKNRAEQRKASFRRFIFSPAFPYFIRLLEAEHAEKKNRDAEYQRQYMRANPDKAEAKLRRTRKRHWIAGEPRRLEVLAAKEAGRPKPEKWGPAVWGYLSALALEEREKSRRRYSPGRSREWRKANPQKSKESSRAGKKRRRAQRRPEDRILAACRRRLTDATRGKGGKSAHTLELLGCSPEFLRAYLENQFTSGMSWETYAPDGWHVDHVKPCSKFDLTKPEEQRVCFHFTNLQPLWRHDNCVVKRDRYPA